MLSAFTADSVITPLTEVADAVVICEGDRIRSIGARQAVEIPSGARIVHFHNAILAPGMIDLHLHGAGGHDVMEDSSAGEERMERLLAAHGVTGYFPTTITAPVVKTLEALERLAASIEHHPKEPGRARPLGIHMEGPFLSHNKRGIHPPEYLVRPSPELYWRFREAAGGHIRMLTIAPELEGAPELIAQAQQDGVCCSLGHSNALAEETRRAIVAGARHATHTFNAMRALDHREPGILGVVLSDPRLTADIIADGVHLNPAVIQLFLKAKGAESAVLITDSVSATGMGDGRHRLGCLEVEVRDGRCTLEGRLAGSVLTLDCAVRNVMSFAGWSLQPAVRLATLNPARVGGLEPWRGRIAEGAAADLVALNAQGEVLATICGGQSG